MDVYLGPEIASYGFPGSHPFSTLRHDAFKTKFYNDGLDKKCNIVSPVKATKEELQLFHTTEYIETVEKKSLTGTGYLDRGDTPAYEGVFESASYVAGSALNAARNLMENPNQTAFIPIAGLHHARRNTASGFCVFNDCGIVLEYLLKNGIKKAAYVDIDAHHGDGVYYGFEDEPRIIFADIHESGQYLFPGTGFADEKGKGQAEGLKLNIEMDPGANDLEFFRQWEKVETFIEAQKPEFILMQCGADSLGGDPLTHLQYTREAHAKAAESLYAIAKKHAKGRMLAVGGGGYNLHNLASAWTSVVKAMLE